VSRLRAIRPPALLGQVVARFAADVIVRGGVPNIETIIPKGRYL
jgi:hypothetical protein